MNARQYKKVLKKRISCLESDNNLMQRIIADSPTMQELYDLFNKSLPVTYTTMPFQEYRAERTIPPYMADVEGVVEYTKQVVARDLLDDIKNCISYEVSTEHYIPTIIASIFVGRK